MCFIVQTKTATSEKSPRFVLLAVALSSMTTANGVTLEARKNARMATTNQSRAQNATGNYSFLRSLRKNLQQQWKQLLIKHVLSGRLLSLLASLKATIRKYEDEDSK